ncbi:MAG: hypothetical protein HDR88_05215 [Bacteroides sp.]|nr:hypothetical protein [Bacteroides sp.]
MKNTLLRSYVLISTFSVLGYLTTYANSPTYPSSAATDVQAADSVKLYPEEQQRSDLLKDSKIIFTGGDATRAPRDSALSLMSRFYDDQFRHSQDPEAPMFTFMSNDADIAMGIGANLVLSGWFNWNGYIPGGDFSPYNIQIPRSPENNKSLDGGASGTNLFFSVLGTNEKLGNYRVFVQGKFNGYSHKGFKLSKAWVQIRDFTAGLATTTFSDPASEPDVLDPAGANGVVSKSNLLLRYLKTFKGKWSVAGSVEWPSSQPDVSGADVNKCLDYVPDIAAFGQYQWNRGLSHVRLAGIMRTMAYRNLINGTTKHVTGWGALLGSTVKAGRNVTFYAQASVGQGITAYTGDLSNGDYDLLATPGKNGCLYAPTTLGATFGVKYFWMNNLTSTVALGTLRTYAKDGTNDDTYKYGQYLAANLIYNITPRMQIGMEYEAGKRMNFNGTHGNANRLQAVFVASF